MIRYLDFNDTYLSKEACHPSDNLSTAIALSESERRDGRELITALIVGYEVLCRLCDASNIRDRGWDHVTYGNISTALVASRLLGLTHEQATNALALAITPNNALRQTRVGQLSMWKGCAFANAARNGVFASLLAREGLTGPTPIFEGEKGFQKVVSGTLQTDPNKWTRFKILETSIKYYSAEYHSQAAIDAALQLRKEIDLERIREINVSTFKVAVQIIGGEPEKWTPKSRETADHSLPYMVAAALLDGELGPNQFTNEKIRDPQLKSMIKKIKVQSDPNLTKLYPRGIPAILEIIDNAGKMHRKRVEFPRGHHRNPMTDKEVEEKFRALTINTITKDRANEFLRKSWKLESITDISDLLATLVRP
jgi:2-methylcitrate dehydratase